MVAGVNSFEVLMQHTEEHRAQLYHEAEVERLVASASARRATLRTRLAQALRRLAERLDTASRCRTAADSARVSACELTPAPGR